MVEREQRGQKEKQKIIWNGFEAICFIKNFKVSGFHSRRKVSDDTEDGSSNGYRRHDIKVLVTVETTRKNDENFLIFLDRNLEGDLVVSVGIIFT